MIGDLRSGALIAPDGAVEWGCFPRFDRGALFAALVGDETNGIWTLTTVEEPRVRRVGEGRQFHAGPRRRFRDRAHRRGIGRNRRLSIASLAAHEVRLAESASPSFVGGFLRAPLPQPIDAVEARTALGHRVEIVVEPRARLFRRGSHDVAAGKTRWIGNYPQTFSRAGLIDAACALHAAKPA